MRAKNLTPFVFTVAFSYAYNINGDTLPTRLPPMSARIHKRPQSRIRIQRRGASVIELRGTPPDQKCGAKKLQDDGIEALFGNRLSTSYSAQLRIV